MYDYQPEISPESIRAYVAEIREAADNLDAADGETIKATMDCWTVKDDSLFSVRNMDDEELRKSVVEDLIAVRYWESKGKVFSFRPEDLKRFVPSDQHERIDAALSDPFVRSLIVALGDGQVRLHPDHLQDAMDFAGVWLEGFEPLTDEPVYYSAHP